MNKAVEHIMEIAEESGLEFPVLDNIANTKYKGYEIELFLEENRILYPYGAFTKGIGTLYSDSDDSVLAMMKEQIDNLSDGGIN